MLYYRDAGGLGEVYTSAGTGLTLRIDEVDLHDLAQLAADLLGESQPRLPHSPRPLSDWLLRYGAQQWGKHRFLWHVARALIWRPAEKW